MGVFFYSNKKVNTNSIIDVYNTRGHHDITDHDVADGTLISAPKIIARNQNYLCASELCSRYPGDYAIGVGTYFYKDKCGREALKLVYNDLDKVIEENPVYGHWAFCIRKNGKTYVFNDMSGMMRLYYYENNGTVIISTSHLSVIAAIKNPIFDKTRLTGFLASTFGHEDSFVKGVKLVNPLKCLVIEERSPIWIDRYVPKPKRIENFEEAIDYCKSLFLEQVKAIKNAIGEEKILIDATGGLDSRLVTAVLKSNGFNFDYMHYPLYGPDTEIANILAQGLNKNIVKQTHIPIGENYGNHYGEFDFCHNFFRQYPNPRWVKVLNVEFSGADGECLNLPVLYFRKKDMQDTRLRTIVPRLCTHSIMNETAKNAYVEYVLSEFEERKGISPNEYMTEKDQAEYCQFATVEMSDSHYESAAQAHYYFYQLFNEWHFNHFVKDISFDIKMCRRLTIALIKSIDSEVGNYPFVSRRRTKRNSVNEINDLPQFYFSYNKIKSLMPKVIVDIQYRLMGRKFDESRLNSIKLDLYSEILDVKELKKRRNLYSDILNRLYSVDKIREIFNIQFD